MAHLLERELDIDYRAAHQLELEQENEEMLRRVINESAKMQNMDEEELILQAIQASKCDEEDRVAK